MENIQAMTDEELEQIDGGAAKAANTNNWTGAHWQPQNITMGTTFNAYGHLWYRINGGDTLSAIAQRFKTTCNALKAKNPKTIVNINLIYAGDAIIIR